MSEDNCFGYNFSLLCDTFQSKRICFGIVNETIIDINENFTYFIIKLNRKANHFYYESTSSRVRYIIIYNNVEKNHDELFI